MFNLFHWKHEGSHKPSPPQMSSSDYIPPPPPLLPYESISDYIPPPPPPSPVCAGSAITTAQLFDLMDSLTRIESKLDIILTKIDMTSTNRKKFVVAEPSIKETNEPKIIERHVPKLNSNFVDELMRKIEERKIAKIWVSVMDLHHMKIWLTVME